jgi:hypothetical protein
MDINNSLSKFFQSFSNISGSDENFFPVINTVFFPYSGIPVISIFNPTTICSGST